MKRLLGKGIGIFILGIMLSGCATSYQPNSFTGGYSDHQLNERYWEIGFSGNGYTSAGTVRRYTLLRAAQVALQNDFSHFLVLDDQMKEQLSSNQVTPDQIVTRADGYGGVRSTYRPGTSVEVSKHSAVVSVFYFNEWETKYKDLLPTAIPAENYWDRNKP